MKITTFSANETLLKIVWKNIKQFYLLNFIVLWIMFTIVIIIKSHYNFDYFLFCFAFLFALVLSILIGSILLLDEKIFRPKREKRLFNNPKMTALTLYGYQQQERQYLGPHNGFIISIFPIYNNSKKYITIAIPVDLRDKEISSLKALLKKYQFRSNKNGIVLIKNLEFIFSIPKTNQILNCIGEFTNQLLQDNIRPVKDWND